MASWRGLGRGLKAAGEGLGKVVLPAMEEITRERRQREALEAQTSEARAQALSRERNYLLSLRGTNLAESKAKRETLNNMVTLRNDAAAKLLSFPDISKTMGEIAGYGGVEFDPVLEQKLYAEAVYQQMVIDIGGWDRSKLLAAQENPDHYFQPYRDAAGVGQEEIQTWTPTAQVQSALSGLQQEAEIEAEEAGLTAAATAAGAIRGQLQEIAGLETLELMKSDISTLAAKNLADYRAGMISMESIKDDLGSLNKQVYQILVDFVSLSDIYHSSDEEFEFYAYDPTNKDTAVASEKSTGAKDIALINIFQRLIDPNVSVRQGDVDILSGLGTPFDNLKRAINTWLKGEKKLLDPRVREALFDTANKIIKNHVRAYYSTRRGLHYLQRSSHPGTPPLGMDQVQDVLRYGSNDPESPSLFEDLRLDEELWNSRLSNYWDDHLQDYRSQETGGAPPPGENYNVFFRQNR